MRVIICFIVALFVSIMLRAPTVDAANWMRSGNIEEREWDSKSSSVTGVLGQPPENTNNCSEGDKAVRFNIAKLARAAGSEFDVNKIYVDGIGTGESALDVWLTDWWLHGYGFRLVVLGDNPYAWTNKDDVFVCVGSSVQTLTSDKALQSILLWYDGPISTDTDQGASTTNIDEAVTASGSGQTGSDFGGPGIGTKATGSANSGKPDFVVSSLKLRTSGGSEKYEFDPGQTISMEAVVKNSGDADSPEDIEVHYYLSGGYKKDSSGDRERVGTENIRDYNMEVGESKTETATFSAPSNPGKVFNIIACADGASYVTEKYESNNCSTEAVFRINGPFNFVIQSIVLGWGKTALGIGEPFSVDVVAKNLGDDAPTDVKVSYYISGGSIGTTPVIIGYDNIKEANFKAGVLKSEALEQAVAPKIPGLYTLTACVDFGNKVKESDENDNCLTTNVQVNDPSPNPAHRKTSTSILHLLFAE